MRYFIAAMAAFLLAGAAPQTGLPNHQLTPGAIDPHVTQANIQTTICVHGYTKTVRPPSYRTTRLKREQIVQYGYADTSTRDKEEDHLISLELGGAPMDPHNLWPEPYAGPYGARVKDRVEDALHRLVCSGRMPLRTAQKMIATDWISAGRKIGAIK